MANRKELKKEIQYFLSEVVEECYSYAINNPEKDKKEITVIIDDAADMYDKLLSNVSDYKSIEDPKKIKEHFNNIKDSLYKECDVFMERLSKL